MVMECPFRGTQNIKAANGQRDGRGGQTRDTSSCGSCLQVRSIEGELLQRPSPEVTEGICMTELHEKARPHLSIL
jgi:hypothetical protein